MDTSPAFDPSDLRPPAAPTGYPSPILDLLARARAELATQDRLRDRLRAEHPDRRIHKSPWGWDADIPGTDDVVRADTLEKLAELLDGQPGHN